MEEKKSTHVLSKEDAAQRIAASAIELQTSSTGGIQDDKVNCLVSTTKQPSVVIPVSMRNHDIDGEMVRRKTSPDARRNIFDFPDDSPMKGMFAAKSKIPPSKSSSQVVESSPDIENKVEDGIDSSDEVIHVASSVPRKRGRPRKVEEQSRKRPGQNDRFTKNMQKTKKVWSTNSDRKLRSASDDSALSELMPMPSNAPVSTRPTTVDEGPESDLDNDVTNRENRTNPNIADHPRDWTSMVELKRSKDRAVREALDKINEENEPSEVEKKNSEEPNPEEPTPEEPNPEEPNSWERDEEESDIDESSDEEAVPPKIQMFGRDEEWRGVIKAVRKIRRQAKYCEPASTVVNSLAQCIQEVHRHYDQYTGELKGLVAYGEPLVERLKSLIDSTGQMDRSNQDAKKAMQTRIRDIYLHGIPRLVLLLERLMTICDELGSTPNDLIAIREIVKLQGLTIALCEKPKFCERAANIKFIRPNSDTTYVRAVKNMTLPPLRAIHKTFSQELRKRQDALHQAKLERKREQQREVLRQNAQTEREEKDRIKLERRQKIYEDLLRNREFLRWR